MKAIDLFCGAGGMSLGAMQAGIEVVGAIDIDKYAVETYSKNFTGVKILREDIRNLDPKTFPDIDLVFGGPPCQGFSTSNQRNRNKTNSSNWLFEEFVRVVSLLRPRWVVLENVKGIVDTEKGYFLDQIISILKSFGYAVNHKSLNAADFGVPQYRSRVFIVANREAKEFLFPIAEQNKLVTVYDAIYDLPYLENGSTESVLPYNSYRPSSYAQNLRNEDGFCANHLVTKNSSLIVKRYKCISQGGNWENIPKYLMTNYKNRQMCHTGIYRRLAWDRPSCVIGNYRKNMLIHPEQDRGLSVREAARLQSFPDWFEFTGSIGFQQQQVGNAVPPILAKTVFKEIVRW